MKSIGGRWGAGTARHFPAVVCMLAAGLAFAREKAAPSPAQQTEQRIPDQETFGFDVLLSESGNIFARVTAGHMVFYKEEDTYLLGGNVQTDLFNTEGSHTSVIYSDSAEVNRDGSRLAARKNVIAKSDSGITMATDVLYWDNTTREIFTDAFVTIVSDHDTLQGMGFISDATLENWKIKKPQGITNRTIKLP